MDAGVWRVDQAWKCVECSGWRKETSLTEAEQSTEVKDKKHGTCANGEGPRKLTDAGHRREVYMSDVCSVPSNVFVTHSL